MKYMKDIVVLVLAVGLMSILGLIVYDEFAMANEHGGELDENIIGLLQMTSLSRSYLRGRSRFW